MTHHELPTLNVSTVKPVLSSHAKIDKTKILITNGSLMNVESIAECSPWSILLYFGPAFSDNWSLTPFFCLFDCGCFRQVLLILSSSLSPCMYNQIKVHFEKISILASTFLLFFFPFDYRNRLYPCICCNANQLECRLTWISWAKLNTVRRSNCLLFGYT